MGIKEQRQFPGKRETISKEDQRRCRGKSRDIVERIPCLNRKQYVQDQSMEPQFLSPDEIGNHGTASIDIYHQFLTNLDPFQT